MLLTLRSKNFRKSLIITSLLLVLSLSSRSFAVGACTPSQSAFEKIQAAFQNLDVRRTVQNMYTSLTTDSLSQILVNGSPEDLAGCAAWLQTQPPFGGGSYASPTKTIDLGLGDVSSCQVKEDFCNSLFNTYKSTDVQLNDSGSPVATSNAFANGRAAGSVLGIAISLNGAIHEPLPVNLAYYWNDNVNRLPLMNKSLAATVSYSSPLLGPVYSFWVFFRNLAYGILSIIMVVVGFMIMSGRKISQQAVVTVQYALPKIVIALALITFSYPIGAVMAQLGYTLLWNAPTIIANTIPITDPQVALAQHVLGTSSLGISALVVLIFYRALAQSGIGIALMLLTLVLIAAIIIIYIMMAIKLLIIYLKMLAMIIYAPIVFAVSAIPGSEDHMVNWFKKLLAYTLSLPAVTGAAALTSLLGISVLLGNSNSPNALVWYGGVLVTMFVSPIIIIGGFFIALKLPDQIEAAIVGDTGGGKKRR